MGGNIKKATYTVLIKTNFGTTLRPTSFIGKRLNQGCLKQVLQ